MTKKLHTEPPSPQKAESVAAPPHRPSMRLAEKTFLRLLGHNNDQWLDFESSETSRVFQSRFIGTATRKGTGKHACTHTLAVAHLLVNIPELKHLDAEMRAYVGLNHDFIEDYGAELALYFGLPSPRTLQDVRKIAECLVKETWRGKPELAAQCVDYIVGITDDPLLEGKERLASQLARANADKTGLLPICRIADKLTTYADDYFDAKKNGIPFRMKEASYIPDLIFREEHAQKLNAPCRLKRELSLTRCNIEFLLNPLQNRLLFGTPYILHFSRKLGHKTGLMGSSILSASENPKSFDGKPSISLVSASAKKPKGFKLGRALSAFHSLLF